MTATTPTRETTTPRRATGTNKGDSNADKGDGNANKGDGNANKVDGDVLKASWLNVTRRESTRQRRLQGRRQRAAFLQWLESFALFTATDSHVGSGQGSFFKFTVC